MSGNTIGGPEMDGDAPSGAILSTEGLTKQFGPLTAIDDVSTSSEQAGLG